MTEPPKMPLWTVSAREQMEAAVEQKDWEKLGHMAVDGILRGYAEDHPGQDVPFAYAVLSVSKLGRDHMGLLAAAALQRLYNKGRQPQ